MHGRLLSRKTIKNTYCSEVRNFSFIGKITSCSDKISKKMSNCNDFCLAQCLYV